MRKLFQRFCILIVCLSAVLYAGCSEKAEIKTVSEELVYPIIKVDDDVQAYLTQAVNNYLNAVKTQSYYDLLGCATDDFEWCSDETAFINFVSGIQNTRLDGIDFDNVQKTPNGYIITVEYTLIFSGSYTDTEGVSQLPGEYEYNDLFTIAVEENEYKIQKTEHTAKG